MLSVHDRVLEVEPEGEGVHHHGAVQYARNGQGQRGQRGHARTRDQKRRFVLIHVGRFGQLDD